MKPSFIPIGSLLTALLLLSSLAQGQSTYISQIKDLPIVYLAEDETIWMNADEYFQGYNLSFSDHLAYDKYKLMKQITLNGDTVTSAKLYQSSSNIQVALLINKVSIVVYNYTNAEGFSQVKNYNISQGASISSCTDLDYIQEGVLVLDCVNSASENIFAVYSIYSTSSNNPVISANNVEYLSNNPRYILPANGYKQYSFISYVPSGSDSQPWQIRLVAIDSSFEVSSVTDLNAKTQNIDTSFKLLDLKAGKDQTLYLLGNKQFFMISSSSSTISHALQGNCKNIHLQSLENMTTLYLNCDNGLQEVIVTPDHKVIFNSLYQTAKSIPYERIASTRDFVIGAQSYPGTISVYEKGQPDISFLFAEMPLPAKVLFAFPVILNNYFILITPSSIQAYSLNRPILTFTNTKPQGGGYTFSIKITSKNQTNTNSIAVSSQMICLAANDTSIHFVRSTPLVNNTVLKQFNQTAELSLENTFMGPGVLYYADFPDGRVDANTFKSYSSNLNLSGSEFSFITYRGGRYTVIYQPKGSTEVQEYYCYILISANPPALNCTPDKSSPFTFPGQLRQIWTNNPKYDIYEINNNGVSMIYKSTKGNLGSLTPLYSDMSCDFAYNSGDNLLEGSPYCVRGNNITVYRNSTNFTPTLFSLSLAHDYKQIMTHPAYPRLLFASTQDAIYIIDTWFYQITPQIIGSLPLNTFSGYKQFLVTQNTLLLFFVNNNNSTVAEYVLTPYGSSGPNKVEVWFRKSYMLYNYTVKVGPNTVAYSPVTDMVYVIASRAHANKTVSNYLLVLQPDTFGSGSLKYALFITNKDIDISQYSISLTNVYPTRDFVLVVFGQNNIGFMVQNYAEVVINTNYVSDNTALYTQNKMVITAYNYDGSNKTLPLTLVTVNTEREITIMAKESSYRLELQAGNQTKKTFKPTDLFRGPALYVDMTLDYEEDHIFFTPKVEILNHTLSTIDFIVIDADSSTNYIALLGKAPPNDKTNYSVYTVYIYDAWTFPNPGSLKRSYPVNSNGSVTCYQVEIGDLEHAVGAFCDLPTVNSYYVELVSIDPSPGFIQIPVQAHSSLSEFAIIQNYIVIISPSTYDAVAIYPWKLSNGVFSYSEPTIVTRDQLFINDNDEVRSLDGLTMMNNTAAAVFIATGSTGFNLIYLWSATNYTVNSNQSLIYGFASDYLLSLNEAPNFHALKLIDTSVNVNLGQISYTLILSSSNAFTYKLAIVTNMKGNLLTVTTTAGYIQYQGYIYRPLLVANKDIVVLVGVNAITLGGLDYFVYDNREQPFSTGVYPLYDTVQSVRTPDYTSTPIMLFKKNNANILFTVSDHEGTSYSQFAINDYCTISTNSSRVNSPHINIVAGNDFTRKVFHIRIINYSVILKGYSTLTIILFVFGSLGTLAIVVWCIRRFYVDKAKTTLKDTEFDYKAVEDSLTKDSNYISISDA